MMKKNVLFLILVTLNLSMVTAQLNEAGIFAGGSNFIGDIGKTNYIFPNSLALGVVYKRNLTPRYAVRATYTYSKIKGNDAKSGNSFKEYRGLSFENKLHELAIGFEFNFFEYNIQSRKHFRTPYIFVEAAVNNYSELSFYEDLNTNNYSFKAREIGARGFNYTIPIGIGYKGRLWRSLGFSIETSIRYTFKNDLDGYYNGVYYPYKIPDSNPELIVPIEIKDSNGNDWYVFTGFTIVYAFDKNSRSWERLWERNQ